MSASSKAGVKTGFRIIFLSLFLIVILLESVGFPPWFTQIVTQKISQGDFFITASGMRLDMISGVYLDNIEIYRKKVVGPPAVSAGGMRIRLNPRSAVSANVSPVSSIELLDGSIEPGLALGTGQEGAQSVLTQSIDIVLTRMMVKSFQIDRLDAALSFSGTSVTLSNIVCSIGGVYGKGTASGWVRKENAGNCIDGRIITDLDPHLLVPELKSMSWGYMVKFIERFEWTDDKPLVDTTFRRTVTEDHTLFTSESLFSMKNYSYRGVSNDTCDGTVSVTYDNTGVVVNVENIVITAGNGAIVGGFAYDTKTGQVKYRTVTDVQPPDFFQMVGLFNADTMKEWNFPGRTRFMSEGLLDFENDDNTRLSAKVDSSGMGFGRLIADQCMFDVNMIGSTCRLTNVRGSIWDGNLHGKAQIVFSEEVANHVSFSFNFDNCDFTKVACDICNTETNSLSGTFSMDIQGGFIMSSNSLQTMTAFGRATVDEGRIFQLPIFGGLTSIMTRIIPGLDFVLKQSDLNAEFKIEDAKMISDKIAIDGGVLSLKARGYTTLNGELDYTVQLTLMSEDSSVAKVLRVITWPISKLMEFRLKGTIDQPEWYPINFSSELLEKTGLKKSEQNDQL